MRLNKSISIEYWTNYNSLEKQIWNVWTLLWQFWLRFSLLRCCLVTLAGGCRSQFGHWGRSGEGEKFSFMSLMWNCWYTRIKSPQGRHPALASPFSQGCLGPSELPRWCPLVTFFPGHFVTLLSPVCQIGAKAGVVPSQLDGSSSSLGAGRWKIKFI